MKKLKQLACGLLAAALLVCALPAAGAEGAGEGQPAPQAGGTGAAPVPAATGDGYVEWNGTTDLPASGKVRLTADCALEGSPKERKVTVSGELTLDLAGHTLGAKTFYDGGQVSFLVPAGSSLTIEDSTGGGIIYTAGNSSVTGGAFAMTGGTFVGKSKSALYVTEGGRASITGGTVKLSVMGNSYQNAVVTVEDEGSSFVMSGGSLICESHTKQKGVGLSVGRGASAQVMGGVIESAAAQGIALYVHGGSTVELTGGTVRNTGRSGTALFVTTEKLYAGEHRGQASSATISGNAVVETDGNVVCAAVKVDSNDNGPSSWVHMDGGTVRNVQAGSAVMVEQTNPGSYGGQFVLKGGTVENAGDKAAVNAEGAFRMEGGVLHQTGDAPAVALSKEYADVEISGGQVTAQADMFQTEAGGEPTVSGGVFNKPVTEYVADGTTAVSVEKSGEAVYAVGGSVAGAVKAAAEGDTVTVLKGDSIEVPDKVTVENKTGKDITVNGVAVPDNGTLTAHRHSAVHVAAKAPTAGQGGNIEYWYCEGCGKYFKDAALTQETTAEGVKLPATGSTPAPAPAPAQKANPKTGV